MSQTTEAPSGTMPEACGSAREFAVGRIEEAETPLGAAELADEYGCTKDHMRHALIDAVDDGEIERIALGRYGAADVYDGNADDDAEPSESEDAAVSLAAPDGDDDQQDRTDEHDETAREAVESGDGEHTSVPIDAPSEGGDATESAAPDGMAGLPMTAVVVGAVVLVGVLFYLSRSSSTSSSSSARTSQTEQDRMNRERSGGLSG